MRILWFVVLCVSAVCHSHMWLDRGWYYQFHMIPAGDVYVDRPDTGKRLVREEDEEGSDEERITMAVNTAARDRERRREAFMAAQDTGK